MWLHFLFSRYPSHLHVAGFWMKLVRSETFNKASLMKFGPKFRGLFLVDAVIESLRINNLDGDTVVFSCRLDRQPFIHDVCEDQPGVALEWVTKTAAAGRGVEYLVALFELDSGRVHPGIVLLVGTFVDDEIAAAAIEAASHPERRKFFTIAVNRHGHIAQDRHFAY